MHLKGCMILNSIMLAMSSGSLYGEAGWVWAVVVATVGGAVWVSSEVVAVEACIANCCVCGGAKSE